jgi:ABC-type Mn2+/Zn2+ transport system permease subunit
VGLLLSTAFDLPSGPVIVWALVALALPAYALTGRSAAVQAAAA